MRRIPNIGSIDECFDDEGEQPPRGRMRPRSSQRAGDKAVTPQDRHSEAQSGDNPRFSLRNAEDTISLDGMTIDEILALSDSPPTDPDDPDNAREDTGEWDAIEEMLDPSVMLREGGQKK